MEMFVHLLHVPICLSLEKLKTLHRSMCFSFPVGGSKLQLFISFYFVLSKKKKKDQSVELC